MKDYKILFLIFIGLFILYWLIFVLTPKTKISIDNQNKIDSLNVLIINIQKSQEILDSKIDSINLDINKVDKDIKKIKEQKTILKEIYHEKIIDVVNFTETELDSFFTNRYK
jgi:vacuolar-type H+-ATPase subunit I/STV1